MQEIDIADLTHTRTYGVLWYSVMEVVWWCLPVDNSRTVLVNEGLIVRPQGLCIWFDISLRVQVKFAIWNVCVYVCATFVKSYQKTHTGRYCYLLELLYPWQHFSVLVVREVVVGLPGVPGVEGVKSDDV